MNVRVWIWKHRTLKSLILFRANSDTGFRSFMSLIKSFRALSPASNCFVDKEELQLLCSLVNSTTKSISEDLLDVETSIVKSIVSSKLPDVPWMKTPVWIWTSFWNGFGSITQLFLPYACCWARAQVSTAKREASFSSVVRILTPYRRCTIDDRKCQLILLGFERNETAANEDIICEFSPNS